MLISETSLFSQKLDEKLKRRGGKRRVERRGENGEDELRRIECRVEEGRDKSEECAEGSVN